MKCPHCGKKGKYHELYDWRAKQCFVSYDENAHIVKTTCCGKGVKLLFTMHISVDKAIPVYDKERCDWGEELNK